VILSYDPKSISGQLRPDQGEFKVWLTEFSMHAGGAGNEDAGDAVFTNH
jgi:hypothetical protein